MTEKRTISSPGIVKRTIVVSGLIQSKNISDLTAAISSRDGVVAVSIDPQHHRMRLYYDVTRLQFADIEQLLSSLGIPLASHGWMRVRAGWYRFTDANARANAVAKGGSCCSQPTNVYAQRHKRG